MTGEVASTQNKNASLQGEILASVPHLRAFARSLTRNRDEADDLVHDAVVRALSAIHQFTPGTNFRAWIFTILRNLFYNETRRHHKKFATLDSSQLPEPSIAATQEDNLILCDFRRAFWHLNPQYREILVLVGASGLSYEEAAKICNCQVGTVKSRVSRARTQLAKLLKEGNIGKRNDASPLAGKELNDLLGHEDTPSPVIKIGRIRDAR